MLHGGKCSDDKIKQEGEKKKRGDLGGYNEMFGGLMSEVGWVLAP